MCRAPRCDIHSGYCVLCITGVHRDRVLQLHCCGVYGLVRYHPVSPCTRCFLLSYLFVCLGLDLCSPGWPATHCVAEADL